MDAWGDSWGDAWGDSWGVDEVATLGFAAPHKTVDFVVSPPYYLREAQVYLKVLSGPEKARENEEVLEMRKMYVAAIRSRSGLLV